MFDLKLDRPLAVFDIESTGINRRLDRIIDLAILKILPGGKREEHVFRVNPGMPIPAESTAIHGITDADVKDAPPFAKVGQQIADLLKDCDLCGYNILSFDIPVLLEEFARAGIPFTIEGRRVLDAQRIFHKKVPRDLAAALAHYCGEMHLNAHSAMDDVRATLRVVEGQLESYSDLPRDMDGMNEFCNPRDPSWADRTGKLKWVNGELTINFGKKQGQPLRKLAKEDPSFLNWIMRSDFPRDTAEIIGKALKGEFPKPPAPAA